jgi:hypothetical protein
MLQTPVATDFQGLVERVRHVLRTLPGPDDGLSRKLFRLPFGIAMKLVFCKSFFHEHKPFEQFAQGNHVPALQMLESAALTSLVLA